MNRLATRRSCTAAMLMWACVVLFAARVIGQFEASLVAPAWLPDMDAWYSGLMPYYLLVPAQIAILMLMAIVAWNRRVRTGCFARANPRTAGALRIFAGLYFAVMAVRLGVNLIGNGEDFWREGAIPVAFHWVLALFLLASGRASEGAVRRLRMPAEDQHQHDETDDIPHGDVPAIAQPLAYGFGFRKQVRYGDSG
jgi:hypothetical protein